MPGRRRAAHTGSGKCASSRKRGIRCQWTWGTWLPSDATLILSGRTRIAQGPLDGENHQQAMVALGRLEVGHLAHMRIPDDANEAGIVGVSRADDPQPRVAPQGRHVLVWNRAGSLLPE